MRLTRSKLIAASAAMAAVFAAVTIAEARPRACCSAARAGGTFAHLPGWTMAGQRILLMARDLVIAHILEEVVRVVELARVLETEVPILVLTPGPLGRAIGCRVFAAGLFARRLIRLAAAAIVLRLDADFIEEWRVQFHDRPLCEFAAVRRKLNNFFIFKKFQISHRSGFVNSYFSPARRQTGKI